MTVLVTGATGFVGAAVARCLVRAGFRIRALVRPASDRRNLHGLDVEVVTGDLTDKTSLAKAIKDCQGLFHVAADYRLWVRKPQEMFATNVDGTRNLMLAALEAGVGRIVYTSSVATLGLREDGGAADEETPVSPSDMIGPYKQSKFAAEIEVRKLVCERQLPAIIVNPSTPIGPGDIRPTPTGRMVVEAAAGRMPAYVDTGLNVVHVEDVAEGHRLAYEKGNLGERYILGGENIRLAEILAEIATLTGRRPPKVRLPHSAIIPVAIAAEAWSRISGTEPFVTLDGVRLARKKMFFSSEKARRVLGYVSRPAREALRDAFVYFQGRGHYR